MVTSAEPVILASVVATLGGLGAQLIARLKFICKPDANGKCVCTSGCTDARLDPTHESITVSEYEMGGKQVIILMSNEI